MGFFDLTSVRISVKIETYHKVQLRHIPVLLFGEDMMQASTHAQNALPTHRVQGQFIKEWLVLGPFQSEDLEADFLAPVGGETAIRPPFVSS